MDIFNRKDKMIEKVDVIQIARDYCDMIIESTKQIEESKREYKQVQDELRAGIINWNTPTTGASSFAPFGGLGLSGNFRPAGFYAADYCSYPVASSEAEQSVLPEKFPPGFPTRKVG